ncbi:MAG TPA: hypothetical protein VGG24_05320 [Paraburkholderia sp.]|jgi:hypothetical protein
MAKQTTARRALRVASHVLLHDGIANSIRRLIGALLRFILNAMFGNTMRDIRLPARVPNETRMIASVEQIKRTALEDMLLFIGPASGIKRMR